MEGESVLFMPLHLRHDLGEGHIFQAAEQCMRAEFVAADAGGTDAAQESGQKTGRGQHIGLFLP